MARENLDELQQLEREDEEESREDAVFNVLNFTQGPACNFATALPSAKATKPGPDHCQDFLFKRKHEKEVTLPTQRSRVAASATQMTSNRKGSIGGAFSSLSSN